MFCSDKLQEFKQKHKELKTAVAKELGFKLLNSEAMDGREKNSDQETGCGKEGEEEGNSTMTESLVESAAAVSVNGSDVEPVEQNQAEGSERAAPDAKTVNGVPEAGATGEENIAKADVKENATAGEARSDEINGEMNGALHTVTSPSGLKGKGTWADIVSNATLANGTGDKVTNVKKVAGHITANGVAEE